MWTDARLQTDAATIRAANPDRALTAAEAESLARQTRGARLGDVDGHILVMVRGEPLRLGPDGRLAPRLEDIAAA